VTDTHSELQFFLPEGYGQGDVVTVFVGGQVNKETITFDYSIPTVTKVTPYCGQGKWFISYVIMVLYDMLYGLLTSQGDPLTVVKACLVWLLLRPLTPTVVPRLSTGRSTARGKLVRRG
jgi:hypothetical protein